MDLFFRRKAGTAGLKTPFRKMSKKAFSHLASAGVAGTQKEHFSCIFQHSVFSLLISPDLFRDNPGLEKWPDNEIHPKQANHRPCQTPEKSAALLPTAAHK
jgi:hypothetical protein